MIIGICGLIGSGKGSVADSLVRDFDFKKISFADKLKDGIATVFDWDRSLLEGDTEESRIWRDQEDPFWSAEIGEPTTPRLLLQLFGTECMRDGFYDGIWVSLVKQRLLKDPNSNYVIPDVRFVNEMTMIRSLKGEIWQIRRTPLPLWFFEVRDQKKKPLEIHNSEWSWILPDREYDRILENNETLDILFSKIKKIIKP